MSNLLITELPTKEELFTGDALIGILDRIEEEARSIVPDLSTAGGRKQIASNAHNVAKSKTLIDNAGKDLVAGIKAEAKKIDEARKMSRDRLDKLKAEVRKPLTDWEEKEESRVEEIQQRLSKLKSLSVDLPESVSFLQALQSEVENFDISATDEFEQNFIDSKKAVSEKIDNALQVAIQREKDLAELAKLRAEKEERERIEQEKQEAARVEKEKKEAEERRQAEIQKAQKEAEEKAKLDAEAKAAREKEEQRIAYEKQIKQEKQEAEQREAKLIQEAEERERKLREEADAIEKKAQQEREEQERKEREEAARIADKKHRAEIIADIRSDISSYDHNGTGFVSIDVIVDAIKSGDISHLEVKY